MFFHPSQAVKYVIKPGQNSLSAASLIIFFDFQDTRLLKISALIEIIRASLFIFVSVCSPLFFLAKANFPRHKEAITFPLSSHKHGVLSFYSSSISSLAYPILFFLRGAIIYFNRLFIVYFRQISFITPVYFGKKLSFSKKITVFFAF